jgi:hypothetical protein
MAMIDNPQKTARLLAALKEAVPFTVYRARSRILPIGVSTEPGTKKPMVMIHKPPDSYY